MPNMDNLSVSAFVFVSPVAKFSDLTQLLVEWILFGQPTQLAEKASASDINEIPPQIAHPPEAVETCQTLGSCTGQVDLVDHMLQDR